MGATMDVLHPRGGPEGFAPEGSLALQVTYTLGGGPHIPLLVRVVSPQQGSMVLLVTYVHGCDHGRPTPKGGPEGFAP